MRRAESLQCCLTNDFHSVDSGVTWREPRCRSRARLTVVDGCWLDTAAPPVLRDGSLSPARGQPVGCSRVAQQRLHQLAAGSLWAGPAGRVASSRSHAAAVSAAVRGAADRVYGVRHGQSVPGFCSFAAAGDLPPHKLILRPGWVGGFARVGQVWPGGGWVVSPAGSPQRPCALKAVLPRGTHVHTNFSQSMHKPTHTWRLACLRCPWTSHCQLSGRSVAIVASQRRNLIQLQRRPSLSGITKNEPLS